MNLLDNFINAFLVIFLNKLRSVLSMLGIIIGVSSVIVLVAVGEGAQQSILSRVQALGTNLITVTPGVQKNSNVRIADLGGNNSTKVLTDEHTAAIKEQIKGLNGVAPELSSRKQVIAGSNNTNTKIDGVTPDYETVKNFKATYGQFISQDDIDENRKVAVLGSTTATNLFGTEDPMGKDVIIASRIFTVIGVMETKGSTGMSNSDDVIFIPLSTAEKVTFGTTYLSSISISVTDSEQMTTVMEETKALLMKMLNIAKEDDINFTIQNQADALETVSSITDTLKIFI